MTTEAERYPIFAEGATAFQGFLNKVFGWMFAGLAVSGVVAFALEPRFERALREGTFSEGTYIGVMIAQLVVVLVLTVGLNRLPAGAATFLFLLYAGLTGVTFAAIFTLFEVSDIAAAFFATAGMFGAMALIGYTTKRDLTRFASFLYMALIGVVIASVIGLFADFALIDFVVIYVGLLVFLGLTVVDVWRLKKVHLEGAGTEAVRKAAIYGALQLYLDFINIFIRILLIMGRSRR